MTHRLLLSALTTIFGTALVARAGAPVADALRGSLQTAEKNFVAEAETMPADKYAFKPTEKNMTFGDHMAHMGQFSGTMCKLISGSATALPAKVAPTAPKADIVKYLHDNFAYCTTTLAGLDDSGLAGTVSFFGSPITRAQAILILSGDWSDHYAVTATYLRLNGLLPPTAK